MYVFMYVCDINADARHQQQRGETEKRTERIQCNDTAVERQK